MQFFSFIALPMLAAAAPTFNSRAGAPAKQPLPSDCTISHTYPTHNSTSFAPTASFESANELYSYSLSPGATTPDGKNDTQAVNDCLETCYSFGNPGQCKSVWSAHGVSYNAYGTTVHAEFVCKLYGSKATSPDLGPPAKGDQDSQAHALTLGCARKE